MSGTGPAGHLLRGGGEEALVAESDVVAPLGALPVGRFWGLLRRWRRVASFGLVGGIGTVANLMIMGGLMAVGTHYVLAAVAAAELTIMGNFLLQERMVFAADRAGATSLRRRFMRSFTFNNAEALLRLPVLMLIVEFAGGAALIAQGATLAAAFVLRYLYHSRVIYAAV